MDCDGWIAVGESYLSQVEQFMRDAIR